MDVYLVDVDGKFTRRLTLDDAVDQTPSWSLRLLLSRMFHRQCASYRSRRGKSNRSPINHNSFRNELPTRNRKRTRAKEPIHRPQARSLQPRFHRLR